MDHAGAIPSIHGSFFRAARSSVQSTRASSIINNFSDPLHKLSDVNTRSYFLHHLCPISIALNPNNFTPFHISTPILSFGPNPWDRYETPHLVEILKTYNSSIQSIKLGWKGRWLNRAGRFTLVSLIVSSMLTYHRIVFPLAAWVRNKINKIKRSFLWKGGEENGNGDYCLINWPSEARPKDLGGLGISDLE